MYTIDFRVIDKFTICVICFEEMSPRIGLEFVMPKSEVREYIFESFGAPEIENTYKATPGNYEP